MPLPQFLLMLVLVIVVAAATVWLATSFGIALPALALVAVIAAAVAHVAGRPGDGSNHHQGN